MEAGFACGADAGHPGRAPLQRGVAAGFSGAGLDGHRSGLGGDALCSQSEAGWITIGAGARIGLVTGLLAAWLAFSVSGSALFVERFVLHQAAQIDSEWKTRVDDEPADDATVTVEHRPG